MDFSAIFGRLSVFCDFRSHRRKQRFGRKYGFCVFDPFQFTTNPTEYFANVARLFSPMPSFSRTNQQIHECR